MCVQSFYDMNLKIDLGKLYSCMDCTVEIFNVKYFFLLKL